MYDDTLSDTNSAGTVNYKPDDICRPVVIPFKPRVVTPEVTPSDQNTPDPAIVAMFERYLKAAQDGKIAFAAIAFVDNKGVAVATWEPEQSTPQLITQALGAVSYLDHRFALAADNGAGFIGAD